MMNRRISRRNFLVVSGGTLVSLAAFGCGGTGGVQQPEGETPEEAEGRTRVVFWTAFDAKNGEAMQKLVDDFNASQEDIFVENQFQGNYEETAQKLATALAAQQVPDMVVLSEVTWNRFFLDDTLEPLTSYFGGGDPDPEDYVESLIGEGTREGEIWWVPFARSTPLLYYNRDMFEQAGLPDRGPETWDEMREWGQDLVRLSGNPKAHAFTAAAEYNAWFFHGNVWQWGGNYSDENFNILIAEDPAVEAGEFARRLIHEDELAYMADNQEVDFANGLAATTLASTGGLGGITDSAQFEVGTAMLPEQRNFGCPTGGAGLGILAAAPDERKQAAFEFIKFAARPENVAFWSTNTGYMPVTKSAQESSEMQSYFQENPNFKVAVDQLPSTQPQDTARTLIPNGDNTIGTGLERIFVSNEPAESVFQEVAQQLETDAQDVREQAAGRV
ncbi:MAG: Glycerol-3-phosphate ABC transporter, substrate-binding protein UgpB [uncultured Rubrobacteraceae bacterium]|uniref:Glycerol-3-phosphate ABC transporter, substrate-binding protein UgpB n=1 Tax=uncultured Rubrobacteraceae bacterium TaxID=349277 RepID=A0A6J4Q349_9ACTN|nr:MAG: Glycerol-3-phosphate ABC transporter, substrate-binding protein UgpB [uncultured Rubrobacteraceae bacterium]